MTASVAVPLWLFLILCLLAAWAAGVLLLAPGMRWFFRRRINAVIEELNTRLKTELPSFKLTRREVLIDRVWGTDYVGDTKTLDVHVKRLRGKIEADPARPAFIVTQRGAGYLFDAVVEAVR